MIGLEIALLSGIKESDGESAPVAGTSALGVYRSPERLADLSAIFLPGADTMSLRMPSLPRTTLVLTGLVVGAIALSAAESRAQIAISLGGGSPGFGYGGYYPGSGYYGGTYGYGSSYGLGGYPGLGGYNGFGGYNGLGSSYSSYGSYSGLGIRLGGFRLGINTGYPGYYGPSGLGYGNGFGYGSSYYSSGYGYPGGYGYGYNSGYGYPSFGYSSGYGYPGYGYSSGYGYPGGRPGSGA